ncbi:putative transposase for insertion sequence element IS986/IS6110 [Mycobacterium tuberculosis]|nr:putative transposase for insertion sequence element IS986/IS6110 [Mycobacterium tuberculosis]
MCRPGQGSPTWPLSPTPTLAGSWAGGSLPRWPPPWSSTRSSKPSGPANKKAYFDLKDVIHHTDRGSQYTSIRFSERLAEAGIQPSVGAVGSSYDNALAETINGLYKTELIKPGKPWRSIEDVELATARWVDWFNHRRLYQYCGDVPPVELEAAYYAQRQRPAAG